MAVQHSLVPHPPLSAFVDLFWSYEGTPPAHPKERRLPDGSMAIIINLHHDLIRIYDRQHPDQFQVHRGCLISGAHSVYTLLDSASQTAVLGVEFKPGGALPFLGMSSAELHNQILSLELLWGREAAHLREHLLATTTPAHRFAILEQALLARLAPSKTSHPAIRYALKAFQSPLSSPSIAQVAEHIGLSQTRFIQVFSEAVGLTPKLYCRIQRFQHALQVWESGTPIRWAELALACGYFDQAHFNHDFQAFAGLTPEAYRALRGEYRNHIALVEEQV